MALKSNCKQAKANIQAYIMENFDGTNYGIEQPATFKECAEIILDTFRKEYLCEWNRRRYPESVNFREWCAGLPSILDTCYYYNRPAVDDVARILEETPEEANKYSEDKAEELLSYLIYRELINAK